MSGTFGAWWPDRPSTLVVACSDGRLQEATDEFLGHHLQVTRYDRFYVPGGGGALFASGRDFLRAQQLRRECRYLVELHAVQHIVLLFHGPSVDGPIVAACADYRRKLPWDVRGGAAPPPGAGRRGPGRNARRVGWRCRRRHASLRGRRPRCRPFCRAGQALTPLEEEVPLSLSISVRQVHRWLSIIFTVTVIANFVALTRGEPPAWVT